MTHQPEGGERAESRKATTEYVQTLLAHFASPAYAPPSLPAIALEVQSLARKPNADAGQLIKVLEKDPLLAARLLKIARSAAFSPGGSIGSLRDAVVRLGLRNVSEIAWEVAFGMRVFRTAKYAEAMEAVQRHSTACAYLARLVSSQTAGAGEYAFLCGLLHDVGMAATLIVFGEPPPGTAPPDEPLVGPVLRVCHEEASRLVARLWKLPDDVQVVVGAHHGTSSREGPLSPLVATLVVAEALARELGRGIEIAGTDVDPPDPGALARAREVLALDDERLARVRDQAQQVLSSLAAAADG